jgi:glycosyltransferase involved in cell wall biosynthesis
MARTLIIVPCYNEEGRFDASALDDFVAEGRDIGFVLVNDGSTDKTLDVLRAAERRGRVQVIDQQPNQGKAEAVRVGMLQAMRGGADYVGYFDADLATPLDAIPEFVEVLDENPGIGIVIGARVALLGRQIERRASRHYLGRIFATAARLVLAVPVYDTQCGAKLFRNSANMQRLFERPFGSRWIFDVEIFARYLTSFGDRSALYELPLRKWTDVGASRVRSLDFLRAGGEMAAIYRTYRLRRDLDILLGLLAAPFSRYVGAGGLGTLLHYLVLILVVELFVVPPAYATVVGACVGAMVNYVLSYHFTFASSAPHGRTLPKFFTVAAISAGLSGLGLWYATHRIGLHYFLAQVLCTGAVLVIGFVLNKLWTFRTAAPPVQVEPERSPASTRDVFGPASAPGSKPLRKRPKIVAVDRESLGLTQK